MAAFLTLKGSWRWPWILYTVVHHYRPLRTCQISLKSKKLFVDGRTDVRTHRRTFETGFIRSTLFIGYGWMAWCGVFYGSLLQRDIYWLILDFFVLKWSSITSSDSFLVCRMCASCLQTPRRRTVLYIIASVFTLFGMFIYYFVAFSHF